MLLISVGFPNLDTIFAPPPPPSNPSPRMPLMHHTQGHLRREAGLGRGIMRTPVWLALTSCVPAPICLRKLAFRDTGDHISTRKPLWKCNRNPLSPPDSSRNAQSIPGMPGSTIVLSSHYDVIRNIDADTLKLTHWSLHIVDLEHICDYFSFRP